MKIPDRVSQGQPVSAEDFNALRDALLALQVMPGVGYGVRASGGGTTLILDDGSNDDTRSPHAWWADVYWDDDAGEYKAAFVPGVVHDGGSGEVVEVFPTPEDAIKTVEADDIFYVHISTDPDGVVVSAVFEKAEEPEDVPHRPGLGASGQAGEYYLKAVKFKDEENGFEPEYFLYDSIQWQPWSAANMGQGANVLRDYNEQRSVLTARSLVADNTGGGSEGGSPVELTITEQDQFVEFKAELKEEDWPGYGVNGRIDFKDCEGISVGHIEVVNGLVTSISNGDLILGDCACHVPEV